jgi:hypothetical protein
MADGHRGILHRATTLDADEIDYDNSGSGLVATDVQAAIDEVITTIAGGLDLQGGWNANTNTPDLTAAGTHVNGHLYIVTVSGATDPGNGKTDWTTRDQLFWSDTASNWITLDNSEPLPEEADKGLPGLVTAIDGDQATASTVTNDPVGDSEVAVYVNGIKARVGDGVKTDECYFSGDAGATARAFGAIVATDTLHWVGSVAGYQIGLTDSIDFVYVSQV